MAPSPPLHCCCVDTAAAAASNQSKILLNKKILASGLSPLIWTVYVEIGSNELVQKRALKTEAAFEIMIMILS